jgi:hypothetical protein
MQPADSCNQYTPFSIHDTDDLLKIIKNYEAEYSETSIHYSPVPCIATSIIHFFWSL